MSQFWTDPWAAVEATRSIEIATEQNQRYLEIAGEPCYLLKRRSRGEMVAPVPSSGTIEPDPVMHGFYRLVLWDNSMPTDHYPLLDSVEVYINGVKWDKVYDTTLFTTGAREFAVDEWRDKVDVNNIDLPDGVYAILNTPPFNPNDQVIFNYSAIAKSISQESMQPITVSDALTAKSLYGYDQYLNPNALIRGRIIPHAFLLAFPLYQSDLTIQQVGMQLEAKIKHWTQAPPYAPEISEHDVVVRMSTWKRYEIINQDQVTHAGLVIQQQFDMTELNIDAPEYKLQLVTV